MKNKESKIIDLEKMKEDYYKKLDEDYNQIEHWENEGTYRKSNELEDKRRRKEIERNGFDPDEELPY